MVALAAAELAVEEVFLPNRFLGGAGPVARDFSPPIQYPLLERCGWDGCGRAEQMEVVGHNDVTPHAPKVCPDPRGEDDDHGVRRGQQRASLIYVHADVLDDRLVDRIARRQVRE